MNINYQDKGSGRAIVLLHGWGGSSQSLHALAEKLINCGYRVINVDLPGFGKSPIILPEMRMQDYVNIIAELIKYLELKKPIIVGHSFGGKIALFLAQKFPNISGGIVLINASGIKPNKSVRQIITFRLAKIFGGISRITFFNFLIKPLRYFYYRFAVREMDYYYSNNLRKTFETVVNEHADEFLSQIKLKTLLLWGENDQITPLYMAKKLQESLPNSDIRIIAKEKHNLPLVKPEIMSQEIIQWIIKYNI